MILKHLRLIYVLALFARAGLAEGIASTEGTTGSSPMNYKEILQCGPNSLYMFFILSGHRGIRLEQLDDIAIGIDGSSLLSLRDAAQKFHVKTEIRRYRPEEITSVPLPAIAPFFSSESSFTTNHFNVIYKVDRDKVYVLNGTTGLEDWYHRTRLAAFWNGVALVEKRSSFSIPPVKWTFLIGLSVVDAAIVAVWCWRWNK